MRRCVGVSFTLAIVLVAGGCATAPSVELRFADQQTIRIPQVDACDDFASAGVDIDPAQALTVLVHGCKASSGRFRTLAQVLEASGRQTLCFNYNYRRSIRSTAAELAVALAALARRLDGAPMTVIGHSQGGLVARRALVESPPGELAGTLATDLHLVTIASPFNGIEASTHCGWPALHLLTLGVTTVICQAISGSIWPEIHPRAAPVRNPVPLAAAVADHLQIVTDERDSCRRSRADGSCVEDDYVFSVSEQRNATILADSRVDDVVVRIGHAAIVGDDDAPPWTLLELLSSHGVLPPTAPEQQAAMRELVVRLY